MSEEQVDINLVELQGRHSFWSFSERKKGYSGVVIYCRELPDDAHVGVGIESIDNEGRCVIVEWGNLVLINIYAPNSGMGEDRLKVKTKFLNALERRMDSYKSNGRIVAVVGDFNIAHEDIDVHNPNEVLNRECCLPVERGWFTHITEEKKYIDTFRHLNPDSHEFSWWDMRRGYRDMNLGWRLDYVVISDGSVLESAEIHTKVMGSDHCPVSAVLLCPSDESTSRENTGRMTPSMKSVCGKYFRHLKRKERKIESFFSSGSKRSMKQQHSEQPSKKKKIE